MELNIAFKGFSHADKTEITDGLFSGGIEVCDRGEPYDIVVCAGGAFEAVPLAKFAVTLISDGEIMRVLRDTGCTVITCGTADDDTLSVSSVGENKAAMSLQRRLVTLSGGIIEPCEIPIKAKSISNLRSFEAVTAILLLAGIPSEKGYEI